MCIEKLIDFLEKGQLLVPWPTGLEAHIKPMQSCPTSPATARQELQLLVGSADLTRHGPKKGPSYMAAKDP